MFLTNKFDNSVILQEMSVFLSIRCRWVSEAWCVSERPLWELGRILSMSV